MCILCPCYISDSYTFFSFIWRTLEKTLSLYELRLWSSSHWKQWERKIPFDFTGILDWSDCTLLNYSCWGHKKVLPECQPQDVWTLLSLWTSVKLNHKWTLLCHISIHNPAFFHFVCVSISDKWRQNAELRIVSKS